EGGFHAAGEGLVAGVGEEGVEPEDAVGASAQGAHLLGEEGRVAALPAVADDEDDRLAPQDAVGVLAVEGVEGAADVGAAAPVADAAGDQVEALVDGSAAQVGGDGGEAHAEDEGLDAGVAALEAIEELDEEAAVGVHGAADVAEEGEAEAA